MPTNILATREGLVGKPTASGYVIDRVVPFVALPTEHALHRRVRVRNLANGLDAIAIVLDVGPWNGGVWKNPSGILVDTNDNDYVLGSSRPQAESGIDLRGRSTNHAGIDLGERIWNELEMRDNSPVDWEFVL